MRRVSAEATPAECFDKPKHTFRRYFRLARMNIVPAECGDASPYRRPKNALNAVTITARQAQHRGRRAPDFVTVAPPAPDL